MDIGKNKRRMKQKREQTIKENRWPEERDALLQKHLHRGRNRRKLPPMRPQKYNHDGVSESKI
uniref:Uncharacterized protein n=1 Tax=Cucumis melo TaxID=3656 RepID=A0A9I9DS09_CUCME